MSNISDFFIRVYNFIRHDIWRITGNELSRSKKVLYNSIKTLVLAIRGFISDDLNIKASALTYSILFAIVPIIALFISIARGFGIEGMVEGLLQGSYIDKMNMTPMVMDFVERYLDTAKGGIFIGIGIIILLWSVVNFFRQAENAFNDIWQVKKSRSIIRQFTTYFSIILLIPILIVASSGLSIYINSTISNSFLYDIISPLVRILVKISPFFINWLVFTILYMAIPNTRVKFGNALVAGIIAGTVFQLFQMLYISGQINLSRYNAVYGGFAAIPLLLLWIRISCLIILFGAELSYAAQNIHNFEYETDTKTISIRYRNFLLLYITYLIVKQFEFKKPPLTSEEISTRNNLPIRLVNQLISKLVEASVLIEVYNESNKSKSYQPAIDINQLTAGFLFDRLETHGSELFLKNDNPAMEKFWEKTLYLREHNKSEADKILIKDIC
ncbi:YihY/virulence factor BrkB family protein [Paludibacter sp. 221]|uniref:YihY/virulence factor BrkB family protein n=1 Tax=Paludibacter sp. 221 TaxID=2302939 RepID=UPI0013D23217|nr:YihY/virulence factor BrkB family protein [Paludibacter sp. 221]NDV47637.1 YihY/virulence factor BrkB family protein [Paludibacter sp. 221]